MFLISYGDFLAEVGKVFPFDDKTTAWIRCDAALHKLRSDCNRNGHNLGIIFYTDDDDHINMACMRISSWVSPLSLLELVDAIVVVGDHHSLVVKDRFRQIGSKEIEGMQR